VTLEPKLKNEKFGPEPNMRPPGAVSPI